MNMNINYVEKEKTVKMQNQILRRIYNALADIDTEIDSGDTEPAFEGAVAVSDADKGILRVSVGDRRFEIRVTPSFR